MLGNALVSAGSESGIQRPELWGKSGTSDVIHVSLQFECVCIYISIYIV